MKWCLCQVLDCSRRSSFTSSHLHLWGLSSAVPFHPLPLQHFPHWAEVCRETETPETEQKSPKPVEAWHCVWPEHPDQGKLPAHRIFGMKWNINFKAWKQVSCPSQMPSLAIVGPTSPTPLTSVKHQSPTPQVPSTGEHLLAVLCSEKRTNKSLWSRGQMCLT